MWGGGTKGGTESVRSFATFLLKGLPYGEEDYDGNIYNLGGDVLYTKDLVYCLDDGDAARGPMGLCAESERALTGRRCPHHRGIEYDFYRTFGP